ALLPSRRVEEAPLEGLPVLGGSRSFQVLLDQLVLDHAQRLERVRVSHEQLFELEAQPLLELAEDELSERLLELGCQAHGVAPSSPCGVVTGSPPPPPIPCAPGSAGRTPGAAR